MKNILVLSPHTDDMEFGCGGSVARWVAEGAHVHLLVFSTCEASLPAGFDVSDITREQYGAARTLGLVDDNITIYDFPVRNFASHRQEILEILVSWKRNHPVDLVVLPSSTDIHQDHSVIHLEGVRAFKEKTLLGYEIPWNDLVSEHNFFIRLDRSFVEAKISAIECFRSQAQRSYTPSLIRSLAQLRGMQVKTEYAEAFEVVRVVE